MNNLVNNNKNMEARDSNLKPFQYSHGFTTNKIYLVFFVVFVIFKTQLYLSTVKYAYVSMAEIHNTVCCFVDILSIVFSNTKFSMISTRYE